jgi:hypothetical protein
MNYKLRIKIWQLTLAVLGATPRPASELTAKALSTHEVIVSGTVVSKVSAPSGLHNGTLLKLKL